MPPDLTNAANALKSSESLGAKVDKLISEAGGERGSVKLSDSLTGEREAKQPRLSSIPASDHTKATPTLNVIVGETGRKLIQAQADLATVNLICDACLPPALVNYPEWKYLLSILNSRYLPASSTVLVDDQIPGQAVRVYTLVLEYLKTQFDLTVSYDGATTKKTQSVYTVSFTTPNGASFLIEGSEASDESHTGEHIARVILKAMDLLGRLRFSGISGDSTGDTRLAFLVA